MNNEKIINSRQQQKHDIEANWLKAVNFIPKAGEIIVYDPDENNFETRVKIGNGVKPVVDLPFLPFSRGIIDVATLPEENISSNAIYRLVTATDFCVAQDHTYEQVAYVVDKLPATAVDYRFYYCLSDGKCYGFVDENTYGSDGWAPVEYGWYEARTALDLWALGEFFHGVVTDVSGIDPTDMNNWDTHFIYLQYELYHYAGDRFVKIYDEASLASNVLHVYAEEREGDYWVDVTLSSIRTTLNNGGNVLLHLPYDSNEIMLPVAITENTVYFQRITDDLIDCEVWALSEYDNETSAYRTVYTIATPEYVSNEIEQVKANSTKVVVNIWEDDD